MTKRDWLATGLRCAFLALFVRLVCDFVWASERLAADIGLSWTPSGWEPLSNLKWWAIDVVAYLLAAIVALYFLRASGWIAGLTFRDGDVTHELNHHHVFLIACRIAGAAVLLWAVSSAFLNVSGWMMTDREIYLAGEYYEVLRKLTAGSIATVAEAALALYLLFGARGLVRMAFRNVSDPVVRVPPDTAILGIGRPKEVFSLGVRTVGLVYLVYHLPTLVGDLVVRQLGIYSLTAGKTPSPSETVWAVIMLALSVYFVMGARKLVDLVFREKPSKPDEADEEAGS